MADLHMHSYFSDGVFSPPELVIKALACGIDVMALTDHDTLAGVKECCDAAEMVGIKNIPGIEISTHEEVEAHILGYNINLNSKSFTDFVEELEKRRRVRSEKLINKLREHKIIIPEGYFDGKIKRELSRMHISFAITDLGYEPDNETAFKKWLKEGSATYVGMESSHPREAIEKITEAGGVAVLAHPMRLKLDHFDRIKFIKKLKDWGLSGIEAVYKNSSPSTIKQFKQIADTQGLFVTCGGDFHFDKNVMMPRLLPKGAKIALNL